MKAQKCQFFKDNLKFLGFRVSKEGMFPIPAKIKAIERMKVPENLRDIQCFLGMLVYYRQFVPDFSTIAKPLVLLLRGKVKFCWGESQQKAFTLLKNSLSLAPLLAYPDFDKPFFIQTDASLTALGAVLSQVDKDVLNILWLIVPKSSTSMKGIIWLLS